MTITLIFAAMFCALVAGIALIGGSFALINLPLLSKLGFSIVSVIDRLILRQAFAAVGIQTNEWTMLAKAKVCTALGLVAYALFLLFGNLSVPKLSAD